MVTDDGWGPDDMMNGSYAGGMWMMAISGLVLLALLGAMLFLMLREASPRHTTAGLTGGPAAASPRELLDQRLARGEISSEEYSNTRTLLDP